MFGCGEERRRWSGVDEWKYGFIRGRQEVASDRL
jgi:hypothetical protein